MNECVDKVRAGSGETGECWSMVEETGVSERRSKLAFIQAVWVEGMWMSMVCVCQQ